MEDYEQGNWEDKAGRNLREIQEQIIIIIIITRKWDSNHIGP